MGRFGERPGALLGGPGEEHANTDGETAECEQDDGGTGRDEDEDPADERDEQGERVEPNPVGTGHVRLVATEQDDGGDLGDELDENAQGDEGIEYGAEREKTAGDGQDTDQEQAEMGETPGGMELGEGLEKDTGLGSGVGDPGVPEQQREDGAETRPEDHDGEKLGGQWAVEFLHECRGDVGGLGVIGFRDKVSPRDHSVDGEIDADVDGGDDDETEEYRARDGFAGVFHFIAEITDIVVAEEIVETGASGGAEAEEKAPRKLEGILWKVEGDLGIEMQGTIDEHGGDGDVDATP